MKKTGRIDLDTFDHNKQGEIIVFPRVTAFMTGVSYVWHSGNEWILTYTDGTREGAYCDPPSLESAFSIVDTVQSAARK